MPSSFPPFSIQLAGERVALLPERALYWPRRHALLVADVHLGKAATMRAQAIAIPGGTTQQNLERLTRAVDLTGARSLVVLGDLLHARQGRAPATLEAVARWRERHSNLTIKLVRGNHDRRAGDPPPSWNVQCVDAPHSMEPFVLAHHPEECAGGYTLAGHLHPSVRIAGRGGDSLRLACFWLRERVGILPAFGEFTGTARVRPAAGERVYAIAGQELLLIPAHPGQEPTGSIA